MTTNTNNTELRIIVLGGLSNGWYEASDEERSKIVPALKELHQIWINDGVKILAHFDEDIVSIGAPPATGYIWYIIADVTGIDMVERMTHAVRKPILDCRLDKYIKLEVRIGRPAFFVGA